MHQATGGYACGHWSEGDLGSSGVRLGRTCSARTTRAMHAMPCKVGVPCFEGPQPAHQGGWQMAKGFGYGIKRAGEVRV